MSKQEPRHVVHKYLDAAFVRKDFEGLDELTSSEGLKTAVRGFVAAFPDSEMTFEHEITEGDLVAVRVSATGTHLGNLRASATGGKKRQATAAPATRGRTSGATTRGSRRTGLRHS